MTLLVHSIWVKLYESENKSYLILESFSWSHDDTIPPPTVSFGFRTQVPRGLQKFIHVALQRMCKDNSEVQVYFAEQRVMGQPDKTYLDVLLRNQVFIAKR